MGNNVIINERGMTAQDVISIARHGEQVQLSDSALAAMATTRAHIDALVASSEPVYGVSTGFGALANRYVSVEQRAQLQRSLIRSHAARACDLLWPQQWLQY
jgi:histidine ammonia-lyase